MSRRSVRPDPVFPTTALPPNSLLNRTVIITGASDGVGLALSERCALAGARVVMVGRNEAKTRHAASVVMNRTGSRSVDFHIADLLYLDEQQALAQRLLERYPSVYALVNNAGALFLERKETRDGLERSFALNHVAYVSLSLRLLPALLAGAVDAEPARVINMSSRAHRRSPLDLTDLQSTQRFSGWAAYGRSKLANILFTRELARRVDARRLVVHAVHPGLVATRFAANNGRMGRLQRRVMDAFSVSPMAGSDTAAWLLASDEGAATTGRYWVRRQRATPSRAAQDERAAAALWDATIALAGLSGSASLSIIRDAEPIASGTQ